MSPRLAATAPALCAHGAEAALCRDEQSDEVRAAVDYAHRAAFDYSRGVEPFADAVALEVARCGHLEALNLAVEWQRWVEKGGAA